MSERRSTEPVADLRVDRSLPVPVQTQLVGQMEFGVATGRLAPGQRLPSVRDLAQRLGVSPVTISHAFKVLRERGILSSVPGRGTFVSEGEGAPAVSGSLPHLVRSIDALIRRADRAGIARDELANLVATRIGQRPANPPVAVHLVGIYAAATRAYATELQERLGTGCTVTSSTFGELTAGKGPDLGTTDLVLTFPYRRKEVEDRVGANGPPVASLRFLPTRHVRADLASLSPFQRVGVVSTLPSFLPTFLEGVQAYARHVASVRGTVIDASDVDALIATSDVIVYATGAEAILEALPIGMRSFEYRHEPDPVWVDTNLLPIIETIALQSPRERLAKGKDSVCTSTT